MILKQIPLLIAAGANIWMMSYGRQPQLQAPHILVSPKAGMDTAKRDTSKTVEAVDWQEKTKEALPVINADKAAIQNKKQTVLTNEIVLDASKPKPKDVSVGQVPQANGEALFESGIEKMNGASDKRALTGIVTDQDSGQPLAGAIVKLAGSGFGAVTDAKGCFVLRNVPEKINLEVSYIGYATKQVKAVGSDSIKIALQPIGK